MKIALFGGSFDPPHVGHKKIIKKAAKKLDVDKVFVNVAYLNPFKSSSCADAKTRLSWMQKICSNIDKAEVLDYEVSQNRPVATLETVLYLYKKYKIDELFLIVGADNLSSLHTWHRFKKLSKLVSFIVVTRGNTKVKKYKKLKVDIDISSTRQRERLSKKYIPKEIQKEVQKAYGYKSRKDCKNFR